MDRHNSFVDKMNSSKSEPQNNLRRQQMDQSLSTVTYLLTEYRELLEEKTRCQVELDNENRIVQDLKMELKHHRALLRGKDAMEQLGQHLIQLDHVKKTHQELTESIYALESHLACLDQEAKEDMSSDEQKARQVMMKDEQEFKRQMDELERKRRTEGDKLRKIITQKSYRLKGATQKAEFEHFNRKEDLRKSLTNELKATGHHLECRSIELDLKKQIIALEKELAELTVPPKSANKRNKTEGIAGSATMSRPTPRSASKMPLLPLISSPSPAAPPNTKTPVKKRRLFSVNSDFMDF